MACLFLFYINSLKTQVREANASLEQDEKEIQQLSTVQNPEYSKVDREFLEKFFTYQSNGDRYHVIKPFMTDWGLNIVQPSEYQVAIIEAEFL